MAELLGITPVWSSEIEPLCVAVLKERFPKMKHLGDINNIKGSEIEPVDIITFGSPCQDLSIAGNRKGLDGERSNLFLEATRIIYEMREVTKNQYPKYIIWENVPGAFSSNKGLDFRRVLEEITKTSIPIPKHNKWAPSGMVTSADISVAWRQMDAQFWGVPQRRKRIYLIGSFAEKCAGEILFDEESLSGNFEKGYEAWKKATKRPFRRTQISNKKPCTLSVEINGADGRFKIHDKDITQTLTQRMGTGGHNVPLLIEPDVITFSEKANTLRAGAGAPKHIADFTGRLVGQTVYCLQGSMINRQDKNGPQGSGINENVAFTLNGVDKHAVSHLSLFHHTVFTNSSFGGFVKGVGALRASGGDYGGGSENLAVLRRVNCNWIKDQYYIPSHITDVPCRTYGVRTLTPTECERLQGFPDNWTRLAPISKMSKDDIMFFTDLYINDKKIRNVTYKVPAEKQLLKWYNSLDNDMRRYKALGNSVAIPCVIRALANIPR